MSNVNSKVKGSRFERTICKWFKEWTGYEFSRTPASGGLRWKKTDNIVSDIICTDDKHSRKFPFSIECKFHKEIKFEHILLGNKNCKILSFWEQASSDADRGNKIPILVMKYNGMPKEEAFFVVGDDLAEELSKYPLEKPSMKVTIRSTSVALHIYMASDIKENVNYKEFYRAGKALLKLKK